MDENGEQRVGAKRLSDETVDRLSNLPECLLLEVLLNLPTEEVVKTSVLSSRWRNLWKFVPGLDLKYRGHQFNAFVRFVDRFLAFNSESRIQNFKIKFNRKGYDNPHIDCFTLWINQNRYDIACFTRWINTVVERKVQHLHVSDALYFKGETQVQIPRTIYKCESLVSLDLCEVILASPEFVSLPCVKVINLGMVEFANDMALELLISGCPVLESLTIKRNRFDKVKVLRVRSQSLLRFEYVSQFWYQKDPFNREVAIHAPRLEYLKLKDPETTSFILTNSPTLVKVDINIGFRVVGSKDPQKRNMIRNLLVAISSAKDMKITSRTLKVIEIIYDYSRYERLPRCPNLSFLEVCGLDYKWEMLLIFLGSCPNLKSLVMKSPEDGLGISCLPRPQCLKSSLEFVKIGGGVDMELVRYFLEKSPILKKLTLCLVKNYRKEEESIILKELHTIPRLSASCQVVVI